MSRHARKQFGFAILATLTLATAPLLAQGGPKTGALPAGFEWMDATSRTHRPFGLSAGVVQQVWPLALVPGLNRIVLFKAVKIRRDRQGNSTAAFWVECEMGLGSYGGNARKPSTTFAANQAADFVITYKKKRLNIPAVAPQSGLVQPWLPAIPLDAPFILDRYKGKGLLWEARIHQAAANSPGSTFLMDGHSPLSISIASPAGTGGAGCIAAAGLSPLTCQIRYLMSPVSVTWQVTLANCPPSRGALIAMGRTSSQFGVVSLPFDLAPLGAPGCHIYTEPLVFLPVTASAAGTVTLKLTPVATTPAIPLYAQGYVIAPKANALGLATSNGAVCYTKTLISTASVYEDTSPAATTGKLAASSGIVLGIDFL